MRNVSWGTKEMIVTAYQKGISYSAIQEFFGVNRWNIQDALSKMNVKTNRIKSSPRLPRSKKKGKLMDRYHNNEFVIPAKEYSRKELSEIYSSKDKNFVLPDDLDIMERMDEVDDANDFVGEPVEFLTMEINNEGKVSYVRRSI